MLPSFAAAKPLLYTRRPISHICSRSFHSFITAPFVFMASSPISEFRIAVSRFQMGLGLDRGPSFRPRGTGIRNPGCGSRDRGLGIWDLEHGILFHSNTYLID